MRKEIFITKNEMILFMDDRVAIKIVQPIAIDELWEKLLVIIREHETYRFRELEAMGRVI